MTALTVPETVPSDVNEEESHYFCWCNPNRALCGLDLRDSVWVLSQGHLDSVAECTDCYRLNKTIGIRCGSRYCITRAVRNRVVAGVAARISLWRKARR